MASASAILRSGQYDWVLAEITQECEWQPGQHGKDAEHAEQHRDQQHQQLKLPERPSLGDPVDPVHCSAERPHVVGDEPQGGGDAQHQPQRGPGALGQPLEDGSNHVQARRGHDTSRHVEDGCHGG